MLMWAVKRMFRKGRGAALSCVPSSPQDFGAGTPQRSPRDTARTLADAIERAMQLGLWEHADRVAKSAERLAHDHPVLCERLVRLHVAQGDPQRALDVVEAGPAGCMSLKLWRAICLLQTGRRDEAHLDLRQWALRSSAPLAARRLLALLEWQVGDIDAAMQPLLMNLRQIEDSQSLVMLTLISAAAGRRDCVQQWASRLLVTHDCGEASMPNTPSMAAMLESLGVPAQPRPMNEPTSEQIDMLALELLAEESAIPALVEAQRLSPQPHIIALLGNALACIAADLQDRSAGYSALIQLAMLRDDRERAMQWASRAAEEFPMSMEFARIAQELQGDAARRAEYAAEEMPDEARQTRGIAA